MLTTADVMTRDVITVTPETSVREIAKLLYERHISGVPVVDEAGNVVGVVSEGDLIRHEGAVGESPRSWWLRFFGDRATSAQDYVKTHGRLARDVMTKNPITVGEAEPLAKVARLLERHRIKRVPVVADHKLTGIVTRANILRGLAAGADVAAEGRAPAVAADDRAIAEKLLAKIRDEGFGTFVNPIVQDGTVHLWGLVDDDAERRAIVLLTQDMAGVKSVEDHLAKRPPAIA